MAAAPSNKADVAESAKDASPNGPAAQQAPPPKAKPAPEPPVPQRHDHMFEYPEQSTPEWELVEHLNSTSLSRGLAQTIITQANRTIQEVGSFTVVLSGGSLIKALMTLSEPAFATKTDWSKWYVFWADERCVPLNHKDSNYKLAQELLSRVDIPDENIYAINDKLAPEAAAEDYETRIEECEAVELSEDGKWPRFDLMLLGVGPDGHVASLFPNHPLLAEKEKWVAAITNSPKPPPERITLTLPVINNSHTVLFVVSGKEKAEVLQRILEVYALPGALPAQMVRPEKGKVLWYADKAATASLNKGEWEDPKKWPRSDLAPKKK